MYFFVTFFPSNFSNSVMILINRDEALSTKDSLEKKMKEMMDKLTVAKAELLDSKQVSRQLLKRRVH